MTKIYTQDEYEFEGEQNDHYAVTGTLVDVGGGVQKRAMDVNVIQTVGGGGGGGGGDVNLDEVGGVAIDLGQEANANSIPVTVSTEQEGILNSIKTAVEAIQTNQLPNSHDVTIDNASIPVTQSGTWDITNITGTVSLPTGAATAANQLPGGHNVTVDNGAGASAVNIQDGGNSITVDGSVSIINTADLNLVQINGNPVDVDQGNADVGTQRVTIAENDVVQVKGNVAAGSPVSGTNPVVVGFQNVGGNNVVPTGITAGAFTLLGAVVTDITPDIIDIKSSGELYTLGFSTDGTKANTKFARVDSSDNVLIVGNVAHDAADSGNPVKIGGKVETTPEGPTVVADADRVDAWFSDKGQLHTINHSQESTVIALTDIEDTYDNVTTSANSADIPRGGNRVATFLFSLSSSNTPTTLRFSLEVKSSTGTYHTHTSDYFANFRYDDVATASGIDEAVTFEIPICDNFRIAVTTVGTTASNTFTISDAEIYLAP